MHLVALRGSFGDEMQNGLLGGSLSNLGFPVLYMWLSPSRSVFAEAEDLLFEQAVSGFILLS